MKKIAEFFHRIFEILSRYLPESELSELKSEFEEIRAKKCESHKKYMKKWRESHSGICETHKNPVNLTNPKTCENGSKTQIFAENSAISAPKGGRGGFLLTTSTNNPNGTVKGTNSTSSIKEKNIKKRKNFCQTDSEEIEKNFEIFWQAWPQHFRKTGKKGSLRKFAIAFKVNKGLTFEAMMKGLEWWKKSKQWQDPQYIPNPAVWLNNCRWEAPQNAPDNKPQAMATRAVPPLEEKRETISPAEFAAILKGGNNGTRTAIQ